MLLRKWATTGAVCGLDGLVLVALRPRFARLAGELAHPRAWVAEVGSDRALAELCAAALWLTAAGLGVGVVALYAGRLPGTAGRLAAVIGQVLVPSVLRRMLAGSAGLGVLLAPVAAGAVPQPGAPPDPGPGVSLPAPSWPVTPAHTAPTPPAPSASTTPPAAPRSPSPSPSDPTASDAGPSAASVPVPTWPSSPTSIPKPTTQVPTRPAPTTPPGDGSTGKQPARPTPGGERVQVRPGDSLWLIAARRLGPAASADEIAGLWPRWYAANRDLIGPDPGLIRPGQVLHAPEPATTSPKETSR